MKSYLQAANTSMAMSDDPNLRGLLRDIFEEKRVSVVVETGTYLGLGSTRMVSESFPPGKEPEHYFTIEANRYFYKQAVENLKRFPFVEVLWGRSVAIRDAIEFIRRDDALIRHQDYPEVYIDVLDDPVEFYENELRGGPTEAMGIRERIKAHLLRLMLNWRENLLEKLLTVHGDSTPFVILDSAGGIGMLEFEITLSTMGDRPYHLLLDDIHHLKHFRSAAAVLENDRFNVISSSRDHGWMLASYDPVSLSSPVEPEPDLAAPSRAVEAGT